MARRKREREGRGLALFVFGMIALLLVLSWVAMPAAQPAGGRSAPSPSVSTSGRPPPGRVPPPEAPVTGEPLRVHFYDVSQGLAALVDLPGGRHILVDTGDSPTRERCGSDCSTAHRHLLADLARDLAGAPIDLLWITHQHSDHIGGARDVLGQFLVKEYVDNGREPAKAEVARTHEVARARGAELVTVSPTNPFRSSLPGPARVTAVLPPAWPADCNTDPNECSLALRIDYGASSILFTGDAERGEERVMPLDQKVTLLQVGHHGSETSSTDGFLARAQPRYAVISAGHPGEGMNADYCLPRASTLEKVNRALGGGAEKTLLGFDGKGSCRKSRAGGGQAGWVPVPVTDRLWATERDGDVVLVTRGDGVFVREGP
jgi:beta-lactamase superfamily II metal-dependent hydrolase